MNTFFSKNNGARCSNRRKFVKKMPMSRWLILILMTFGVRTAAQNSLSLNPIKAPFFFKKQQDLAVELHYETRVEENWGFRFGLGFGIRRNKTQQFDQITGETTERTERYRALAGIFAFKYYPFDSLSWTAGFYGGGLVQFGGFGTREEYRRPYVFSATHTVSLFYKMSPIVGYSQTIGRRWMLEPEIGYFFGATWAPLQKPANGPLPHRWHAALHLAYRLR